MCAACWNCSLCSCRRLYGSFDWPARQCVLSCVEDIETVDEPHARAPEASCCCSIYAPTREHSSSIRLRCCTSAKFRKQQLCGEREASEQAVEARAKVSAAHLRRCTASAAALCISDTSSHMKMPSRVTLTTIENKHSLVRGAAPCAADLRGAGAPVERRFVCRCRCM